MARNRDRKVELLSLVRARLRLRDAPRLCVVLLLLATDPSLVNTNFEINILEIVCTRLGYIPLPFQYLVVFNKFHASFLYIYISPGADWKVGAH